MTAELDKTHALLAPGQGNQRVGMGRDLARISKTVMGVWETASKLLYTQIGADLKDIAWDGTEEELQKTAIAQLAIVTDSLARTTVLKEVGLYGNPGLHAGLSVGGIAALVNAGAIELSAAVQMAKDRGEVFREVIEKGPKTTMVALRNIGPEVIEAVRKDYKLSLCLINTPKQFVLGGLVDNVETARANLIAQGFKEGEEVSLLRVDAAFHSEHFRPGLKSWRLVVAETPIKNPTNGIIFGGSTAMPLATSVEIKRELGDQLVSTERFRDVIWALRARGVTTFTELNAASRLTKMIEETLEIFPGKESSRLTIRDNGKPVVIGHRLLVPWEEKISRNEISGWYRETLADRIGEDPEEIGEDSHFVDSLGLESGDLMWLRAQVRKEFGRVVPDDEASMNVYLAQAIDATYRLANS